MEELARVQQLQAHAQAQQALAAEQQARMHLEKLRADEAVARYHQAALAQGVMTPKSGLGLQVEVPGAVLADQLNLPKNVGLVVINVLKGTPAEKAGFQVN